MIADVNGLCVSAKGELAAEKAGRYTSIVKLAGELATDPNAVSPSILIETEDRNILVKEYDALNVVISCTKEYE